MNHVRTYRTYTGVAVDPGNPRPEDVRLEDIARHLAKEQRFGGAVHLEHYSVAEHSVLVSRLVRPPNAILGLFHDAAEAYLKDIPTPVKLLLGDVYKDLERRWLLAIGRAIGLGDRLAELPVDVKIADSVALATEYRDCFFDGRPGNDVEPSDYQIAGCTPRAAYRTFMKRWFELTSVGPI